MPVSFPLRDDLPYHQKRNRQLEMDLCGVSSADFDWRHPLPDAEWGLDAAGMSTIVAIPPHLLLNRIFCASSIANTFHVSLFYQGI